MAKIAYLALFLAALAVTSANAHVDVNITNKTDINDNTGIGKSMWKTNELMMKDLYLQIGYLRADVTRLRIESDNFRSQSEHWKNVSISLDEQNTQLKTQLKSQNDQWSKVNATLATQNSQLQAQLQAQNDEWKKTSASLSTQNSQLQSQFGALQQQITNAPKSQLWTKASADWWLPIKMVAQDKNVIFEQFNTTITVNTTTKLMLTFNAHAQGNAWYLGFMVDGKSAGGDTTEPRKGMWHLQRNRINVESWLPVNMVQFYEVTAGTHTITIYAIPDGTFDVTSYLNGGQMKILSLP